MADSPLRVGLISLGFIGKVHAACYQAIPLCFSAPNVSVQIAAVLRSAAGNDENLMRALGNPVETTSMDFFLDQGLDLVDICSPNFLHHGQIMAALNKNIAVYCEKPLALNLSEARGIVKAARDARVLTHTAFTMRYNPAVQQAKAILTSGVLGEIYNFRAHLFHNSYMDPKRPISWRLQKAASGGGSLADLGIHMIDILRYLLGEVDWVKCRTRTLIPERPIAAGATETTAVDVDDWALCMLGLRNQAEGVLEVTRMSGGVGDSIRLEIFGSQGSIDIDFSQNGLIRYYDQKRKSFLPAGDGFSTPQGEHAMADLLPPAKTSLGSFYDSHLGSIHDFLLNIHEQKESAANFQAALSAQEVLEAAYLSASSNIEKIALPLP